MTYSTVRRLGDSDEDETVIIDDEGTTETGTNYNGMKQFLQFCSCFMF